MRAPATVAVRVTVNRGAESMGEAQPRREQSRSGEGGGGGAAGREGEGRWPTLGGEPPSGWKRGREWVRVQGVEGVGGSCANHAVDFSLRPRVGRIAPDNLGTGEVCKDYKQGGRQRGLWLAQLRH